MASIRFEAVSKRYGPVVAVDALSLDCADGEMLALLGPSGCGKSSTLKMAAGIETVSGGEIWFGDKPVSHLAPAARNIAMVFEDYALYPHLTVAGNVGFPLSIRGLSKAEVARRVDDVLGLLGLRDLAERSVRGLSGGAQQRVAIGRALVREPDLILFDEPLSHLDGDQKVQLRGEIKRLQALRSVTSILVTHDQTEAMAMADRIAVMDAGVLQQVAAPQAIYEHPANLFVAAFIGEPPMNLVPAELTTSDGPRLTGRGWSITLDPHRAGLGRATAAGVIAGIRPEHIAVAAPEAALPRAEITMREPRGDADMLTLRLGGTNDDSPVLVAEVPGPCAWRPGDIVGVKLDPLRVHLFDAGSGRNLEPGT